MSKRYIGIDIGGTSARVGLFQSLDSDAIEDRHDFGMSGRYTEDVKRLTDAVRKLGGENALGGISLAIAGEHAPDGSRLLHSTHLQEWADQPIRDDLAKALGCPVRLVNDAEAAAWAEAVFGEYKEAFWFITWGTGVGGSIVERRPDGPQVIASEPGHQVLRWDDSSPRCDCGRRGCFEAYVGGTYLERRFGKPPAELPDDAWQDVTDWFGRGFYNIVRTYPVGRIVMGGGVTDKQARHLPEIERKTNGHLKNIGAVQVSQATHGEDAGMVGAVAALRAD